MNTNSYLPTTEDGLLAWIANFNSTLPTYATKYGFSTAELTEANNAATIITDIILYGLALKAYSQSVFKWKEQLIYGLPSGDSPAMSPIPPTQPSILTGVEARLPFLQSLVARIKAHNAYAKGDGEAMGIEKPAAAPIDWGKAKAQITGVDAHHDEVIIEWRKGKADGVVVYSSYDSQNFVKLGIDIKSPYNDKRPNQTSSAEYRYYKVRYLKDDKEVGEFSDVVKVLAQVQG